MRILREWIQRLWGTIGGSRPDREIDEELRTHLDLAAEEARRRGLAPDAAARAAALAAGGRAQAMEALRSQRGLPWLHDLTRDVRHGLRTLRRSPSFTAVALLTLALGVGANTAIYQLLDAIRIRTLPVPASEQLVLLELADVTRWNDRRASIYPSLTNPLWEQLRDHQRRLLRRSGMGQCRTSTRPPRRASLGARASRQRRFLFRAGRRGPRWPDADKRRRSARLRHPGCGGELRLLAAISRW